MLEGEQRAALAYQGDAEKGLQAAVFREGEINGLQFDLQARKRSRGNSLFD